MVTMKLLTPLLKREFIVSDTVQLLKQTNLFGFFSWGVSKLMNVQGKGLLMKVNGHHHKGYVLVTLDWMDTYEVHIISTHGNIKDTYTDIYFDELFEVIDNRIEKIPDYKK